MGVVYFSIIPTFEPSRYCKCWIVCFYDTLLSGAEPKMSKSRSMFQGGGIAVRNAAEEGRSSCVWCHSHTQFFKKEEFKEGCVEAENRFFSIEIRWK